MYMPDYFKKENTRAGLWCMYYMFFLWFICLPIAVYVNYNDIDNIYVTYAGWAMTIIGFAWYFALFFIKDKD